MAVARVEELRFAYPGGGRPALDGVSLEIEAGEVVALLGSSGSGKSTLLRALAGLVPHFHGGSFAGRVEVLGRDTRRARPAELAGAVATVFQDPEDQVVMTGVASEVAFGLENLGVPPAEMLPRVARALAAVGAEHLVGRRTTELSSGELQRVCLASAFALEPRLLLLDEPTSQLDPDAADAILELALSLARERGVAVVVSEQRPERVVDRADRILALDGGRLVTGGPAATLQHSVTRFDRPLEAGPVVCRLARVTFGYGDRPVLDGAHLELRRGEIVVLTGPNGSGKTTLAKLAAGLLEPQAGRVERRGRAAYLSQDPGRYLACERAEDEVALGVGGDGRRARRALATVGLTGFEDRHPRDLSSGERERLALAAVLVVEPDLLVLDEPTRGVDPARKAQLAELLRGGAAVRATLVVTHDETFGAQVGDRVVSLGREREAALV